MDIGRSGTGGLLRRKAALRSLLLARAVSTLGDSVALVALIVHVQGTTGAAAAVALLLLAADFVPGLLSPLAGALADRASTRSVLIGTELIQGALALALATVPALPILVALVAALGVTSTVGSAAARAGISAYVDDEDLESANSLLGVATYGLEAVGPLVAAALFLVTDVRGLLLVDAGSFLLGALVLAWLPRPGARTSGAPDHTRHATRAGLRYVWTEGAIRTVALGFFGLVLFGGVDDVALVFLAVGDFGATESATSALYAGVGLGLAAGFAALTRLGRLWPPLTLLVGGFAVSAAGNLLTGIAPSLVLAMAVQVLRGLGIAALDVGLSTHVQRRVPAHLQGRVFAILYGAASVAAGISYAVGGWFLGITSARVTLVVAGAGGLVVCGLTAIAVRRQWKTDTS